MAEAPPPRCSLTAMPVVCWASCTYAETGRCARYLPLAAPGVMLGEVPAAHTQRIVQIVLVPGDQERRLVILTDHGRVYALSKDQLSWVPFVMPEVPHV